jgi:hypothetical protein
MIAEHTLGPWTVVEDDKVTPGVVVFRLVGAGGRYLGTIGVGTDDRQKQSANWLPLEEARANARLALASPDMLEALVAAKAFGSQGETHDGVSVSYLIDKAIVKATVPPASR